MKNVTSIDLDSTFAPKQPEQPQPQKQEEAPVVKLNWNDIMTEWCYRIPKGYPTVVDGVFTEYEEVKILNEILEEKLGESVPLPKQSPKLQRPLTLNEASTTDQKEESVCIVADLCNLFGANMVKAVASQNTKQILDLAKVKSIKQLAQLLLNSKYNYYLKDIGAITQQLGMLGIDPKGTKDNDISVNSIKSGLALYARYGKAYLIRDEANFLAVKKHGPKLWKKEFNETLFEDNWCPADIFISKSDPTAIAKGCLQTTSINTRTNIPALNDYFSNPKSGLEAGKFIGISLKQEEAQAGKGTKFTTNVLLGKVPEKTSTVDSNTKGVMIGYKGFSRYEAKPTKKDIKQPALKILDKGLSVLEVKRNVKQGKDSFAKLKLDEVRNILTKIGTIENYHILKASKNFAKKEYQPLKTFVALVDAKAAKTAKGAGSVQQKRDMFVASREKFIQALKKSNVLVKEVTSSNDLVDVMQKKLQGPKFDIYLVQKISTYDFFVDIFNNWSAATKKLKPYFTKMSAVSNPFVALAMFCIAEAGISPMFTKLKADHWDDFSHDYVIDAKKSADNVKVSDSPTAGGFDANFNIYFGKAKSYSVKLSFRFADKSIRAEVVNLKSLKP